MSGIYDNENFFARYARMNRSTGLERAGEWKQLEKLIPDVRGKCVLDLGCGMGWHAKYFADHGASHVLAVDLSEKMLERARTIHADPVIEYREGDLASIEDKLFDLVFANLSLHYIEDLDFLFRHMYSLLAENGTFLFNIEHPAFTASDQTWAGDPPVWKIDDYFYEGKRETVFLDTPVIKYHHTLTTILNGLLRTGFVLEAIEEVLPSRDLLDEETYALEMKRPMMLLVKARRPGS